MKKLGYLKNLSFIAMIGFAAFYLAGCASAPNCTEIRYPYSGALPKTQINTFHGRLDVTNATATKTGDLMRAGLTLQSYSSRVTPMQYQVTWYNKQGFELSSTPWQPFMLYSNSSQMLQALAPNPTATQYRIRLCDKK